MSPEDSWVAKWQRIGKYLIYIYSFSRRDLQMKRAEAVKSTLGIVHPKLKIIPLLTHPDVILGVFMTPVFQPNTIV